MAARVFGARWGAEGVRWLVVRTGPRAGGVGGGERAAQWGSGGVPRPAGGCLPPGICARLPGPCTAPPPLRGDVAAGGAWLDWRGRGKGGVRRGRRHRTGLPGGRVGVGGGPELQGVGARDQGLGGKVRRRLLGAGDPCARGGRGGDPFRGGWARRRGGIRIGRGRPLRGWRRARFR